MCKTIHIVCIVLFFSLNVKAQEKQSISLQKAIDIALEHNYQLKQAGNNLDLAKKQLTGEKADFLPSLSASASGSKRIGRQFNEATGDFGDFTINGFNSSLSASVPLFAGFENINSLKSSRYNKDSEKKSLQRSRENVIFNTASAYLQVVLDKELLSISNENLKASQKTLDQVKAQVDVGSRPKVDQYNQEATVANNELDVVNKENALKLSRLKLVRQLQLDPTDNYSFTMPKLQKKINPKNYDLDKLVSTALKNRSDLQSERLNIQSLQYQLKATRGSLYPSLDLSGSVSSSYNDKSFNRITGELLPFNEQYFDRNINRSLRLSLSIPIFNNLSRRLNVESQEVNYKNAKLSLENSRLQVVQEVTQAYNDYESIVQQIKSTKKALKAAQKSYDSQQARYKVGAGTLIELTDSNAQYVEAKSNKARAVYNFIFQQKLLDYYIGKLNGKLSL